MSNWEFKSYFEFTGGQNSSAAPDNIGDNELRWAVNIDILARGALKLRDGSSAIAWDCLAGLSAIKIDRTAEFSTTAGVLKQLVLANGNLYLRTSTTPLLTGCGNHMSATVYNNKLYLLIKNSYYVYDGTTIVEVTNAETDSMLATVKKCKYITVRADRVFAAGNPDAPNTLYYSQVGDPTYFKAGQFLLQAASADGDAITGLREFNEALLVFKARGIWAWTGYTITTDVKFTRLNVHTGTRAERTICNVGTMLYYLGSDGVYAMKNVYTGTIDTVKVSGSIDDLFQGVHNTANAYENTACAIFHEDKYMLSFCRETGEVGQDMTINNATVVCHTAASNGTAWTQYLGRYFRDALNSVDGTLYYAHEENTAFWKFDKTKYTDEGADILWAIRFKDYDMGSPVHLKKFKRGWAALNQQTLADTTVTAKVYVDYDIRTCVEDVEIQVDESLIWDAGLWGTHKWGWIDTVTRSFEISSKGMRVGLEISGVTNETLKNMMFMYGIAFMYKMKKPYKNS